MFENFTELEIGALTRDAINCYLPGKVRMGGNLTTLEWIPPSGCIRVGIVSGHDNHFC